MWRQGDVLVMETKKPNLKGMERQPDEGGRVILQHGTATGHNHALTSPGAELWRTPSAQPGLIGDRILRLPTPADLVHDEHGTIALPAGDYIVRIQREFADDAARNVAD